MPAKAATSDRACQARPCPATIGSAPAKIDNRPAKIEVEIEEGAKPEVVWDKYFSKNDPQPKAVRDAVRRLDEPAEVRPRDCPDRRGLAASPVPAVDVRGPCLGDGGRRPAEGGRSSGRSCRRSISSITRPT